MTAPNKILIDLISGGIAVAVFTVVVIVLGVLIGAYSDILLF